MKSATIRGIDRADDGGMTTTHFSVTKSTICPFKSTMITGYIILLAGVSLVVGTANLDGTTPWDQFVLLTLAGTIVASSTAFLLNPDKEPPRIVLGRAIFAAVAGVVGTRVFQHKIEWIKDTLGGDQLMLFGSGFALGFIGFAIAYALVRTSMRRSEKLVNDKLNEYLGDDTQELTADEIRHAASNQHKRRRR